MTVDVAPSYSQVHAALMWAIDHDLDALTDHRAAHHTAESDYQRRVADLHLVRRWAQAEPLS